MTEPTTFDEFWEFYVHEHSDKMNRMLHFAGTTAGLTSAAIGVLTGKKRLVALGPVLGYGGAWVGHFFIEKNKPASFKYPLWSFRGDFKMWSLMVQGKMDDEVERVMAIYRAKTATDGAVKATHDARPIPS